MPVRIYDLAKKLGLESKELLTVAKELGISGARVASSSLDKITAEYLEEQVVARRAAGAPLPHTATSSRPAPTTPEWDFAPANTPGGRHGLPAVVLATILGHDGSTASLPVSAHQLAAAVESLAPAQACTEVEHPNLAAWRAAGHGGSLA